VLIDSLSRPGGNATGFASFEYFIAGKWLELIKQFTPNATHIAISPDLMELIETKRTTVRFDVINVFDTVHEIRDGTGISVLSPQFGLRRIFGQRVRFG
jgi:hypothetical protein